MLPKVLLVDDHPPNLLALEAVLEGIGAEFVRATSGEEALRRILESEFALILLDVQMPGLDGFETASLIRERPSSRSTPIIFLTAIHRDPTQLLRGYEHGAVDYLLKPFDAHVLRSKVSVFLELWRARERLRVQEQQLRERDRRVMEERSTRRWRELGDAIPIALWAAEPDGTITFVNKAFADYAGRLPEGSTQDAIHELIHEADRDGSRGACIAEGRSCESTFRMRGRDGEYRAFLERTFVERDEERRITGHVGLLTDVEDLRRASEAKDIFLAAATHELRTPVAAGQAVLQLGLRRLRKGRETNPIEVMETVEDQIKRLARLVDDLLDAARLARGALPLEVASIDLSTLATSVVDRFAAIEPARRFKVESTDGIVIDGDASRLDQVLTNLLANAVRYSPTGSPVDVTVAREADHVMLSVRDHGIGVPKDRQKAIFTRFTRAHGTRYGGLGLGLDIALGIVRQHGGDIEVESEGIEGRGSTFRVRLPIKAAS
jgi:PAS domain S-box-containing protein